MSMTENMARVERMALRGLSVDQIMALGLPLSPRTIASIVSQADTVARRERMAAERREAEAEANRSAIAKLVAKYRTIDAKIDGVRSSIAAIIRETAVKHGFGPKEIISPSRTPKLVAARHEAIYLCLVHTPYSTPELGMAFRLDHSTILRAVHRHTERHGLPLPRGMKQEGERV